MSETKRCPTCKHYKEITLFISHVTGEKLQTCSACRAHDKAYRKRRRADPLRCARCCSALPEGYQLTTCQKCISIAKNSFLPAFRHREQLKRDGFCAFCYEDDWETLTFDHIDPSTKEACIASMCSLGKLQEEVKKTRILCNICHSIWSEMQRRKKPQSNTKRAIDQRKVREGKAAIVNKIKVDRGCELCRYTNPLFPQTLCFDHLDEHREAKVESISNLINRRRASLETVKKEIEKCRVLCQNCHLKWTRQQLNHPVYIANIVTDEEEEVV